MAYPQFCQYLIANGETSNADVWPSVQAFVSLGVKLSRTTKSRAAKCHRQTHGTILGHRNSANRGWATPNEGFT